VVRAGSVVLGVAGGAALAAGIGLVGIAGAYARQLVGRQTRPDRPSRILALGDGTVTFARYNAADLPGRYGFWFDDERGYARVGEVVAADERRVTRTLDLMEAGEPEVGMPCRITGSYWRTPAAAGLDHEDVLVPTALGPMPAWFIPAAAGERGESAWRQVVIMAHGWRANRAEPLRAAPAIRAAGWASLNLTYRNDLEAPRAADGKYHLGATEWQDVEAAIAFALRQGAERIVLGGWSMGGCIVLQTLLRSPLAAGVERVILDAPALDWAETLAEFGRVARMPAVVAPLTGLLIGGELTSRVLGLDAPLRLGDLRAIEFAERFTTPMLLLQGDADRTTPVEPARAFAAARPDLVAYEEFAGAGHVRAWNSDEARYERAIRAWLEG